MSVRLRPMVTGRVPPISSSAKSLAVGACWSVVYSPEQGLFFVEDLVSAIEKNFHSFLRAGGEDWVVVGIFACPEEAAAAIQSWIRIPGAPRRAWKEKSTESVWRAGYAGDSITLSRKSSAPVEVVDAASACIRKPGVAK
jgi:hypothetical protein